jgi:2-polyprenyl-6-methoxyphenol hydroxylase-like FAD-dependent oxidoreductase
MASEPKRIVIIGAGIGGLSAAIGLRSAGFHVQVHERAPALEAVGAGLTLQPNAVLALRVLGVGAAIERVGAALAAGGVLRADGTPLMAVPDTLASELERTLGAGIVGIHRATLHEILLGALGNEHVRLDHPCLGFTQAGEVVHARFGDGEIACDALIAADGLHSVVRAALHGPGEPEYAGYTSFRGITADRCGLPKNFGGELWGRGQRFGGCAIDGERFYWFATLNAPPEQKYENAAAQKADLLTRFAGFGMSVPALIASTPEQAILRTDIRDRPTLARWGRGAVTLLGDAAHPMTPNLGQGACQAIEDAVVLTRALERAASLSAGLRAYEDARVKRANNVVVTARRLGAIGQWQNPLACALRDTLFSWLPVSATKRQLLEAWRFSETKN